MKRYECKQCKPAIPCVIEWGDAPAPARCPCSGDKVEWSEVNHLPKLTVEALAERGIEWPEWARYAVVWNNGAAMLYQNKPKLTDYVWEPMGGKWSGAPRLNDCLWDTYDWKNSLIERPAVVKENLTTELPEWCKVGAWVYSAALRTEFARITGPGKTSETLSAVTAEGFKCIVLVDKQAISCGATKPARVRPWTFGEAPESVKTAENSEYLECCWHLNGIFKGEPSFFCWKDNFISASKMAETMTQLDGSPCGVLEVVE